MPHPEIVSIAIVGGGASAVLLLVALEKRATFFPALIELHIFEANKTLGRGCAYGTKSDVYMLNTSAKSMSVHDEKQIDFIDWLQDRPNGLGEVPRSLYGDYLEQRLREATGRLVAKGHSVHIHFETVLSINIGRRHRIRSEQRQLHVDHCIVATGGRPNVPVRWMNSDRYIPSALDEKSLLSIPKGSSVGILGTGQSAIDACLFLEHAQIVDRYTLISRDGLLPRVNSDLDRPRNAGHPNHIFSLSEMKTRVLRTIHWQTNGDKWLRPGSFRAMEIDLKRALRTRPSWQTAMSELTPVINRIWEHTDHQSREHFLRHDFKTLRHLRSAIPTVTASKFLTLHRHARLELLAGKYSLRDKITHIEYKGRDMHRTFNYLINASGFDAASFVDLLADDITNRRVSVNSLGGLNVEAQSMRPLTAKDQPVLGLYAIGYPALGSVLIVNSIELIRQCATAIANTIFSVRPNASEYKS